MPLGCVWGCILVREMFCFCFPCSRWVHAGAMTFFCFFLPSAVEWRHLFGNIPRINVLSHEMQTQPGLLRIFRGIEVTTHRIPISNIQYVCLRFLLIDCMVRTVFLFNATFVHVTPIRSLPCYAQNGFGRCRKRNRHQSMTNGCINKIAQIHCCKI